jgi:hypothetical protein
MSRSGSASTRERSSGVPSAATSAWTTIAVGQTTHLAAGMGRFQARGILVTAEYLRLAEGSSQSGRYRLLARGSPGMGDFCVYHIIVRLPARPGGVARRRAP